MATVKVVEFVDIRAPRNEVFETVVDVARRSQLSPLWGVVQIEAVSEDYPSVGSGWCARLAQADTAIQAAVVTDHIRGQRFGYRTDGPGAPTTVWTFQDTAAGARVIYQEEFSVEPERAQELTAQVRRVVRDWLGNIKRYTELRGNWRARLLRRLVDRFYLELRPDQRNLVATIVAMHTVGAIASVMALIALGIATAF